MKNDFKYKNWDLQNYIELEIKAKNLTENDLENVSGGIMNRKLAASVLTRLSILTVSSNFTETTAATTSPTTTVQNEIKNQDANFEITKEQAIEDINYVLQVIKDRHASSVEKLPDEVVNQAKIEIENLKDKVNVIDEFRIVSRIFTKLNDEHSFVYTPNCSKGKLPFDTELRDNKIICINGDFKDYEIVSINDIAIPDLYKKFKEHYPHEIDEWTYYNFFESPYRLFGGFLTLAGIDVFKPIKVTFKKGAITKSSNFSLEKSAIQNNDESWVRFEIDEKQSVGIFTLDECIFNDEYRNTVNKFFTEVKNKNLKNIVVDVRNNSGGHSMVIDEFTKYIKNLPPIIKDFREYARKNDKLVYKDYSYKLTE